jgi:hypothetical protein
MICSDCKSDTFQAKDGLCRTCRMRRNGMALCKYPWTPQMDAQLAQAYRRARGKPDLTRRLKELMRQFGYPRHILQNRAQNLGLKSWPSARWSEQEIETLREYGGTLQLPELARKLRRTEYSVKQKLFAMGLGCAVLDGFSMNELAELFGVHHNKVSGWLAKGWLRLHSGRITHESVERFVWNQMDQYRFASCEEWWLKTMLNPRIGSSPVLNAGTRVAA